MSRASKPLVPSDVLNVNLLGPFGAGKGTQAEHLVEQFGLRHFVAGELLKDEIRRKTALGKRVAKITQAGKLVSDATIVTLFERFLRATPKSQGIVIDGSPRKVSQKKLLDRLLQKVGRPTINIVIEIPESESLRRLKKRLVCEGCKSKPVGKDLSAAECKRCGGKLVRRFDDEPEVIKKRLKVYKREVVPVIEEYNREGRLYRINGKQSRAGVERDLMRLLATLGFSPKSP